MELKKFTIDDILKLDVKSKEIENWCELCGLYGVNAATFEPSEESILEHFIKNYPPEKMIFDYFNMISIIDFGFLFFNKEQIIENNIDFDYVKEKIIKEEIFYYDILDSYFNGKFKQENQLKLSIDGMIKDIKGKNNHIWLNIKKEYESIKLKGDLDNTLENNQVTKKKSPKI